MSPRWKMVLPTKPKSAPTNRASPKTETANQLFLVEKILDKKMQNNIPKYLIKWDGFPSSYNTWEPVHHIPQGLIKDFEYKLTSTAKGPLSSISDDEVTIIDEVSTNGSEVVKELESEDLPDFFTALSFTTPKKVEKTKMIAFAKNLRDKTISSIETVVYKPLKNDPKRKHNLVFIVKFQGSKTEEAVNASDAYSLFPSQVIQYFESIVSFS